MNELLISVYVAGFWVLFPAMTKEGTGYLLSVLASHIVMSPILLLILYGFTLPAKASTWEYVICCYNDDGDCTINYESNEYDITKDKLDQILEDNPDMSCDIEKGKK